MDEKDMSISFYFVNGDDCYQKVLNLNNANAMAILLMLGCDEAAANPWNIDPIPIRVVKEMILIAEGLFEVNASSYTREMFSERNFLSFGLNKEMLAERLHLLKTYTFAAEKEGMIELVLG